ncbi:reverse transcriptase [Caerostris extrusa]|uniref:Reverse transcriptase n=1 Tax=Caerostris extrusa TaxID=172846 RepID=A0AAV4RKI8_CAEEX|nr:reverse transcriptase [Caerostris extrusa]
MDNSNGRRDKISLLYSVLYMLNSVEHERFQILDRLLEMDSHYKDGSNYLEGVPVKISKQFWPPKKVTIPQAIDTKSSSELLSLQYDFSLERSILEYSQKRIKELEEAKQKPNQKSAKPENISGNSSNNVGESIPKSNAQHVLPWQSDTILQPQQLADKTPSENKGKVNNTKINLSDFENDSSSPFDYMELQTINDLEELNSVFQDIHKNDLVCPVTSSTTEEDTVSVVAKSVSFPLPQNPWQTASEKISSSLSEDFGNVKSVQESKYSINPSTSQGVLPVTEENTLPVVAKSVSFPLQNSWQDTSGHISTSLSEDFVTKSVPGPNSDFANASCSLPKEAKDFSCDNYSYSTLSQVPYIPSNAGGSCEKASPLRGCKSYTDIRSVSDKEDVNLTRKRSHTPPSFTSVATESVIEPLPIKEDYFQKPLAESSNGIVNHADNAYEELEEAAKHFVDCITEMGFHKGQVVRAVKHLGVDEKKVVEHLCQIQILEECGYESSEAEAALHLHDYNREQAKEFLDLVNQFQDLGFEKDAVKKALVQNKNDWNKTIDALLP